jgi:MFS family permease
MSPRSSKPAGVAAEADMELSSDTSPAPKTVPKTLRFWGVFVALCCLSFLAALDSSIITTALPTITKEIGGETEYVWIANSFVFAALVPQPLFGQVANVFGRRNPMVVSVALFGMYLKMFVASQGWTDLYL